MNTETIALALLGGGGLAGVLSALRLMRSDKFRREVDASAALLSGYTGMVDELRSEIARVKTETAAELKQQDERHAAERVVWDAERIALRKEVRELRAKVYELIDQASDRSTTRRDRRSDDLRTKPRQVADHDKRESDEEDYQ